MANVAPLLITGASSQLGSVFARLALEQRVGTAVILRAESNAWRINDLLPRLTRLTADLADPPSIRKAVADAKPETLVHLGWWGVDRLRRNDPAQFHTNLVGSLALVKAAVENGCKQVVGLGSQAEYGPQPVRLREDLHATPSNLYGVAKLCAGYAISALCGQAGIRNVWLRLVATYGPRGNPEHFIPGIVTTLLRRERPRLTAGTQKHDYLFVEDAAAAVWAVAAGSACGTFNLGSGVAHPIRDIVTRIRDLIDPSIELRFGELETAREQSPLLEADISKLEQATGWTPSTTLDEGLTKTVDWYRTREANCP